MTIDLAQVPILSRPFYFLRHGETQSNADDTVAGSLDVALTSKGLEQAQEAAAALRGKNITAIYSSELRRARDTAHCVANSLSLPVIEIAELAERNWGELEGKPRALRRADVTPAGGETPDIFRNRILRGLARIDARGLPLVVAHSGVFGVLCRLLGIPESSERVANALPVLFIPPLEKGARWTAQIAASKGD